MSGRIGRGEFLVLSIFIYHQANPTDMMQDNARLAQQILVAALAAVRNVDLSANPCRMTIIKGWGAMFRGARKHVEAESFVAIHNMPRIVGVTGACENTGIL
ncbi:hypothetical protein [Hymenobacter crusticola]|uniref:Uncharacterized protein n=1 Tax=Hymenobacter crusticola TaxID=1770526 RepID=A0A243WIY3_9BACT|nr:hypothetical protein [Hymenobacter crusticola]OUJ75852.1 hypothetical protein BXP70_00710 [Hymenobacter crusticola]